MSSRSPQNTAELPKGIGVNPTWKGNAYATSQTGGTTNYGVFQSAPYQNGAQSFTDQFAVAGFWSRGNIASNTASIVVRNPSDTNLFAQFTQATYCTTNNPNVSDLMGAVVIDLKTNTCGFAMLTNTYNVGTYRTQGLNRTLQLAHLLTDGTYLVTIQMAYDDSGVTYVKDESSLFFYRWNSQSYTNQFWQLAVDGNITNSTFPVNQEQLVQGAPDQVLGHYGSDAVNHIVWANVNYRGNFGVGSVVPLDPHGTVWLIQ